MNPKDYDKVLGETPKRIKPLLKTSLKPFKALNFNLFKGKGVKLSLWFSGLNRIPLSLLFVVFMVMITLVILVANHYRYNFYVELVTRAYPEAVTVPTDSTGKPLYMSQLDRMFSEFNAMVNVGYLVFFAIILRSFLRFVWHEYNPRKLQILGRV